MAITKSLAFDLVVGGGLILALFPGIIAAANRQACDDPPGGGVTCEVEQLAVCRIASNKVEGSCSTPPSDARSGEQLRRWIVRVVTKGRVQNTTDAEAQQILRTCRYERDGAVTTFRIAQLQCENENGLSRNRSNQRQPRVGKRGSR